MNKIGIITILKCNNFGAELQAYATQKKLNSLGYNAEIIDMLYYKHPKFKKSKFSRPFVKQTLKEKITEYIKYRVLNTLIYNIIPLFSIKLKLRNKKFKDFHENNTRMSQTYNSLDSLYSNCKEYDTYIVGSDQVWNPATGMNIEPFFLTFAPKNKNKISYASSFGVANIESEYINKYKELLNRINHISVRETNGARIVKEITGRNVQVVLDPTLLLNKDEWKECSSKFNPCKKGYVLIYEVCACKKIHDLSFEYSKRYSIPIYRVCVRGILNWKTKGITNLVDIGPADFISLFENANIVFTNSFHGTAFSVNMGKNFYSVLSRSGKKNSRITSLLSLLNLDARIIYQEDNENIIFSGYDIADVNERLDIERKKSIDFLIESIKDNSTIC